MSRIRLATPHDAGAVAGIYAPIVASTIISFEVEPPTEQEMGRRIEDTRRVHPWLVYEHEQKIIGYAYARQHRSRTGYQWSVETSVYVHAGYRRCGVGRALYASLLRILAAQGFVNAYAGITLPNAQSVGLHESVGFRPFAVYRNVGYKMGGWHDVGWWHLALREPPVPPAPPVPVGTLQRHPAWDRLLRTGEPLCRV